VLARNAGVIGAGPVRGRCARAGAGAREPARGARRANSDSTGTTSRRAAARDYDFIVSNPPFHEGRADRPNSAAPSSPPRRRCARRAPVLVANRHLPYERRWRRLRAGAHARRRARLQGDRGGARDETAQAPRQPRLRQPQGRGD
jgi:hypothetical protein